MDSQLLFSDFYQFIVYGNTVLTTAEVINVLTCEDRKKCTSHIHIFNDDAESYANGNKHFAHNTLKSIMHMKKGELKERINLLLLQDPYKCTDSLVNSNQYISERVDEEIIKEWKNLFENKKYIDIILSAFLLSIKNELAAYITMEIPERNLKQKKTEESKNNNAFIEPFKGGRIMEKKKIFIVHGHDDAAKYELARVLEKLGLEVIILHECADLGDTIIEKIVRLSNVDYAIVLYTECDIGRAKNSDKSAEKYRARQNVIFEHGYLIGKLGRDRVSAFVKGKVETPGDISGVVYIQMDNAGGWKLQLINNLRSAGIDVDTSDIL